jgi:hypothetical protein
MAKPKTAIVRGPDGAVYILSKTAAPVKMSGPDAQTLQNILDDHKDKFEGILTDAILAAIPMGCGHKLDLTIPDASME